MGLGVWDGGHGLLSLGMGSNDNTGSSGTTRIDKHEPLTLNFWP